MWSIQLPGGDFFDLPPRFNIEFELNNQVFSSGDISALPGSFSFPVELPLTPRNKTLLNNPQMVNNVSSWPTYENVAVLLYGKLLFLGTLSIRSASEKRVRIAIVANPMSRLKNTDITTLQLGGPRTWAGTLLDHMYQTARFPEEYDYVFFSVITPDTIAHNTFDNDPGTGEFLDDESTKTPFVKLEYLLDQIFLSEISGYKFVNEFQLVTEMKRIYLYNNIDSRVLAGSPAAPDYPTEINLASHLPKIKVPELLKKTAALFGLGIFTNIYNKTISIIPLETLLKRTAKHDWTAYDLGEHEITEDDPPPDGFNYTQSTDLPPGFPEPTDVQTFNTPEDFNAALLLGLDNGFYYVESQSLLLKYTNPFIETINYHKGIYLGNQNPLEIGLEALHANIFNYLTLYGVSKWVSDEEIPPTYTFNREDYPLIFMLYRGLQVVPAGSANEAMPLACSHVYEPAGTGGDRCLITTDGIPEGFAERSLHWHGTYGLYAQSHKTWIEMLRNGKPVIHTFSLPVSMLIEFSFEDKIRVRSMEYFVKRLRIKDALGDGLVRVEASMVSVI